MELSIVIVNYRGWRHLKECLQNLTSFPSLNNWFEIIVVDNHSNDDQLIEFISLFSQVRFVENQGNFGFSHGCNIGAANSKGDFILFLNADIVISEQSLFELVNSKKLHPQFSVLSCKHIGVTGKEEQINRLFPDFLTIFGFTRAITRLFGSKSLINSVPISEVEWVSGSVLLIDAPTFRRINGWDERLWLYYEDVDICKRVNKSGGKVGIIKNTTVIHNHGGSTRINIQTTSLTKTEVIISLHVYIKLHFSSIKACSMHFLVISKEIIGRIIPVLLSFPFFFIPKLILYRNIFFKLIQYYFSAIVHRTWISPRSVKYKEYCRR